MVTDAEFRDVIFSIHENKAPGPYGYSSSFYDKAWQVIGGDICQDVRDFFANGVMLEAVNATVINVIPKIDVPKSVSDNQPIACCNVLYKTITKIIATRAQAVMPSLVGMEQSAFCKR